MGIVHIVLFEFKSEDIQDACHRMLSLKDDCLHPTTNKPYVKSAVSGRDNSPEGLQPQDTDILWYDGITHGFVVEFENDEDRKYYLEKDPAHLGFVKSIGGVVARAQVIDFVPGVFG
ncbi:stress responsive A/B barrel domain-containing protein [Acephala macrosclerotiorum]|nr:stress responsive A/B barrel domain-containing protein [Acephala macrosclerotiorum]